jgi:uncharacterized protein YciI
MQFVLIGRDGTDKGALARRMAHREAHLKLGEELKARGELLYAAAILDQAQEKMIGSILVMNFPSKVEMGRYLEREPYVKGDVWHEIEVQYCRVGPSFVA